MYAAEKKKVSERRYACVSAGACQKKKWDSSGLSDIIDLAVNGMSAMEYQFGSRLKNGGM